MKYQMKKLQEYMTRNKKGSSKSNFIMVSIICNTTLPNEWVFGPFQDAQYPPI